MRGSFDRSPGCPHGCDRGKLPVDHRLQSVRWLPRINVRIARAGALRAHHSFSRRREPTHSIKTRSRELISGAGAGEMPRTMIMTKSELFLGIEGGGTFRSWFPPLLPPSTVA